MRLCSDSAVVKVLRGLDGEVLDVGRRTRTIPPAIRRALEIRDQGCRWPGCHLRFTIGHHVESWADGGETKLSNLMLLCRYHHRKVHEGGWAAMYNEKDDAAPDRDDATPDRDDTAPEWDDRGTAAGSDR